jgi:Leucine Rich repeat
MQADSPLVRESIRNALADEAATTLHITAIFALTFTPLTVTDAQCIIECLRNNPRFHALNLFRCFLHSNDAVLNIFRDGLPTCTSLRTVILQRANLNNEDLDRLRPAFYNTCVTSLDISHNHIQGKRGGEVIQDLLVGNKTLLELNVSDNPIGPEGTIGLGKALLLTTSNNHHHHLQKLVLLRCQIGNDGFANLLLLSTEDGTNGVNNNISLTDINLNSNGIQGADGGRLVYVSLQHFQRLKVLCLEANPLGPLGARALAPSLTTIPHLVLETLHLSFCGLGNEGVSNLVVPPDGQGNRSLTNLRLGGNNVQGLVGGENVIALAARCTNLESLALGVVENGVRNPDQRRRLGLLLDRKRLCTAATAIAGSPFSVLFRFVEEVHRHEHGLGAIFVILQNDGDDYFCNAFNRAILE